MLADPLDRIDAFEQKLTAGNRLIPRLGEAHQVTAAEAVPVGGARPLVPEQPGTGAAFDLKVQIPADPMLPWVA